MKLIKKLESPAITVEVYSEEFDFIIKLSGGVIEDADLNDSECFVDGWERSGVETKLVIRCLALK
jgi:hypothetical protein